MSKQITDSTGADIEVFTPEEVAAQKEAAIAEFKAQHPDQKEELEKLQAELKKFQEKDLNFSNLRAGKDDLESKVKALQAEIDQKVGAAKKEVLEGVMVDHYKDTLRALAGDDADLQKRVEFEYKRLIDPAGTKDEVTKKLQDAWVLATKPEVSNALNSSVISSGGVARIQTKSNQSFTAEEKAFGQRLAQSGGLVLKDDDFK